MLIANSNFHFEISKNTARRHISGTSIVQRTKVKTETKQKHAPRWENDFVFWNDDDEKCKERRMRSASAVAQSDQQWCDVFGDHERSRTSQVNYIFIIITIKYDFFSALCSMTNAKSFGRHHFVMWFVGFFIWRQLYKQIKDRQFASTSNYSRLFVVNFHDKSKQT